MTLPPVRRSIEVSVGIDRAWQAVTEEIGRWWPLVSHGCTGDSSASLAFVGDELVETGTDGTAYVWGSVLRREPPYSLTLTWHPGQPAGTAETEVEWLFTPLGGNRSRIEVVHRGWEARGDSAAAVREEYGSGWPTVIGSLRELLEEDEQPEHWFVLAHSPGPEWQPGVPPPGQPGMEKHSAFIESLAAAGCLVAAGPLLDAPGNGQTIIRAVSRDRAVELATVVDDAVATGVLTVEVRPWLVVSRG